MSPPIRTWRKSSLSSVPVRTLTGDCGFLNLMSPASGSGLTETTTAPLFLAFCRALSMRGWLVPGFWPATTMSSASCRSSSDTEPLPTPMVCPSAEPEDSWHMFEQSGRLLVP